MKKELSIGILITILFLGFNFSNAPAEKTKGPKMIIKEKSFDFKQVDEGESIEHAFIVTNEGDEALEIKKVKTG